jgi:hypothetical protein
MSFEAGARAALKAAIAARDEAEARVEASRAAVERIQDQLYENRRRLNEIREQAGERASARVAAFVAGGDAAVMDRDDRFAERDAEEALVACKAARDLCRSALAEAEVTLGYKQRKVDGAIGAVLATAAPKLIEAAESARREFEAKVLVLRFLWSSLGDAQRQHVDGVTTFPTSDSGSQHPALAAWRKAADSLSKDPDAELPGA